jgi:hypothetical protein
MDLFTPAHYIARPNFVPTADEFILGQICHCMQPEPVFVNVYGAQESIPMDRFRQPM